MPIRVPLNTIFVKRDGKTIIPKLNQPFDFTTQELNDINRLMPGAVRKVINEAPDEPGAEVATAEVATAEVAAAEPKKTGRGRGRADSTADGDKPEGTQGDGDL